MASASSLRSIALVFVAIALGCASGYSFFGESRDRISYAFFFESLQPGNILSAGRFEPGFVFISWIAKFMFNLQISAYLAIAMAAALLIKSKIFSELQNPILTVIFYLACWYPLHEYTQVRVAIATSFLFVAFNFLFAGRTFIALAMCAIAGAFHGSAVYAAALVMLAYSIANYRLSLSLPIGAVLGIGVPLLLIKFLIPYMQMVNPLVNSYIAATDKYASPTILSGANILTALFLIFFPLGRPLTSRRKRTLYIVSVQSLFVFVGLSDIPVLAQRLKEIGLVFMTLLAFDYRLTRNHLPQMMAAVALAAWSLYKAIALGVI